MKKAMSGVYSAYRNHCFLLSYLQIISDSLFDVTIVIAEGP